MSERNTITRECLRSILDYDAETGVFTWRVTKSNRAPAGSIAGVVGVIGYVVIGVDKRRLLAHRLAFVWMTGELPEEIDHINGVRSDNRWVNLRPCTRSQNNANRPPRPSKSGEPGVYKDPRSNSWIAEVCFGGKRVWQRSFKTKELAATARRRKHAEIYGEFVRVS